MKDQDKTKEQLVEELSALRQRVAELESKERGGGGPGKHPAAAAIAESDGQERNRLEAILSAAVECLPFEFFALGPEGRYILQNAVTRQHYGDLIGKRPEEACDDAATVALWLDNNRRAFAGQRVEGEVEARIAGETHHLYNVITPIQADGELYGILGVNVDITDRKRAEEALRKAHDELQRRVEHGTAELSQSYDELQAIYDGMSDGLLMVDVQTKRYVKANSSICRMLGYSQAELTSMTTWDLHPADEVPIALQRIEARAEGRLHGHVETRVLRKDGGILYADVVGSRLTYAGRCCVASFFRDITERKQARLALERERRALKHMLQASDRERQLIAYDIHDGLAQELAGAIMQFEACAHAEETDPDDAAKAFDAGMTMLRQSHSETRRLISGVRPPVLDESGVVVAITHLVHDPAFDQGPKIALRSRVTFRRLPLVTENAVYRIVQESLTNARKHSKSEKVVVKLLQRGDRLRIVVRDWGIGFDARQVRQGCFGLEGIRERARLLGGKCRIKSKPGEGTAVIVELPAVERESEQIR
jgi:PAS domain S-box-containing protein